MSLKALYVYFSGSACPQADYQIDDTEWVVGPPSGLADDAPSNVDCPGGYYVY